MNLARLLGCIAAAFAFSTTLASAQQWPEKPVRIIVPYAPGGTIDIIARQIGAELGRSLGQPFVVENRAGAGGIVGTEYVANQPPDGYTVILTTVSHTLTPSLTRLSFDPRAAFVPVIHIADSPQVLFRNPSFGASTLPQVIAVARSQPGKLNYAHGGNGSPANIAAELLKSAAQMDIVGVAFKGAGPVVTAVLSGQIELGVASLPAVASFIGAGRVQPIGVSTKARTASLPNVPTFAEQGVQGYEFNTWFGFLAPTGVPRGIVDRLAAAANEVLRKPEMRDKLKAQGADPVGGTPEDFGNLLRSEFARWPEDLRKASIRGGS